MHAGEVSAGEATRMISCDGNPTSLSRGIAHYGRIHRALHFLRLTDDEPLPPLWQWKLWSGWGLMPEIKWASTDMRGGAWVDDEAKALATLGPELIGLRSPGDGEVLRGDLAAILFDAGKFDVDYRFGDSIAGLVQHCDGVEVRFKELTANERHPRSFSMATRLRRYWQMNCALCSGFTEQVNTPPRPARPIVKPVGSQASS
ncbi:hypothetical protein [Nocardia tengchongensis]|uniref:hypothetical protein n=1 Tax=Nocardia tengchongensis TaxID=2055889 RepID=UPI003622243E